MRFKTIIMTLLLTVVFAAQANAALFGKKDAEEKRTEILEMRESVLERLYDENEEARGLVQQSKGYAVFDNTGINLLLVSTGNGKGIVKDNSSGDDTFMKMFSVGGGIGLGVKTFSAVFVFHTQEALDYFITEGWDVGAQADAAATTDGQAQDDIGQAGLAVNISSDVTIYQMTEAGLALQATLQGTKYWKDEDLN